ncbi:hypothetical protein [Maribellus mangrovi]|uniref:hypothetical protein n=1 Tax=Maribellus mangrovi TaxID=3133146 RepID=UPI0030EB994E
MLRLFLFFILVTFNISMVQAQKLKKRTQKFGNYKEVFHIDKATKFRSGESYLLNVLTKDTLAIGKYHNSSRSGVWRFLEDKTGEVYMIYNFSSDSLIFLNGAMVADSFLVKKEAEYAVENVERPLLYIGAKNEIKRTIAQDLEIPIEVMKEGKVGMSILQYFVDDKGNLSGPKLISGFCSEIEQSTNRKVLMLPGKFLPAVVDGRNVASSFFVRINVGFLGGRLLSKEDIPPYIEHVDIQYGVKVNKGKKVTVRHEIREVDFSEIK